MKLLLVATVLVFSIGSKEAADQRLEFKETRGTPLELLLNLHFFYDRDFAGIAGKNDKGVKKTIGSFTARIQDFFKLSSFPSKILIKVVKMTRLEDKNNGSRTLSQKFRDFKDFLSNGSYPNTTNLFVLLTSFSDGRENNIDESEGSRVCSKSIGQKALIFEYQNKTKEQTAMAITQRIGHALHVKYDDNDRKDDKGRVCNGSLMARNDQQAVWSTCSHEDFTETFKGLVGHHCLKFPEYTLKIHLIYDKEFSQRFGKEKIYSLLQKAISAFGLNSITPKINLKFVGLTELANSYNVYVKVPGHKSLEEFKQLIQLDERFSDGSDLFVLLSAYPQGSYFVGEFSEAAGHACSKAKRDRAIVVKHDGNKFTSMHILRMIALALEIHSTHFNAFFGVRRHDKNGHLCNYGFMGNKHHNRWSTCSVEDLTAYIDKLQSGCGFCLAKGHA